MIYLLLAALAPVALLLWYIYRQDSVQPEPPSMLLRASLYGVYSALLAIVIDIPLGYFIPGPDEVTGVFSAFLSAFGMAAIPEESAKLLLLWLFLRKNPYFDEHMDGIVYAACVGLGFAGFENILYLVRSFMADGTFMTVGISRALFAVPGHFIFAVLMGYYYSLYHFRLRRTPATKLCIWLLPVLAHGVYDGILFSMQHLPEWVASIGFIVFLVFFNHIRKHAQRRIEALRTKLEKM